MGRLVASLLALAAVFAVVIAGTATGARRYVTLCVDSSVAYLTCPTPASFSVEGASLAPTGLPRRKYAPIGLKAAAQITYGTPPTTLRELTIEIDRHGAIDVKGLPVCRRRRLEALGAKAARRVCAASMVGTGTAEFDLDSSGSVSAPLSFFNGTTRDGPLKLLVQAALPPPVGPIVSAMTITPIPDGRYGLRAVLPIPAIDEGRDDLTAFRLAIRRRFRYQGMSESYATARCQTGSLGARIGAEFSSTPKLISELDFPCTPTPPRRSRRQT